MGETQFLQFLGEYGLWFLFIIVFMEYLNLPGFPSGIIMPVAGMWASDRSVLFFILALLVSVVAGVLGSQILYFIGKIGGKPLLDKIYSKNSKYSNKLKEVEIKMNKNAFKTVFIFKLIPVLRTLIGFPAGAIKMKTSIYLSSTTLGVTIWNSIYMLTGTALWQIIGKFF